MIDYSRMLITPEDTIHEVHEGLFDGLLYNAAQGPREINEISDTIYRANTPAPYHVHDHGYETFIIDKGNVEVTLYGKRCLCGEGDIINIEPYMPHGFRFLDEGTIWRELFHEMGMYTAHIERYYLTHSALGKLDDPAFMDEFRAGHGNYRLGEPEAVWVDKKDLPQICPKGEGIETFAFDGITCRLKVGRWQLGGIKEVWEYVIDQGMSMTWYEPHPNSDIFVVKEGSVRVDAAGEVFVAHPRDIINIPPYTPHRIIAEEPGTVLHDYNCQAFLLRMCEEFEWMQANEPEKLRDQETVRQILRKHHCPVTGFRKFAV